MKLRLLRGRPGIKTGSDCNSMLRKWDKTMKFILNALLSIVIVVFVLSYVSAIESESKEFAKDGDQFYGMKAEPGTLIKRELGQNECVDFFTSGENSVIKDVVIPKGSIIHYDCMLESSDAARSGFIDRIWLSEPIIYRGVKLIGNRFIRLSNTGNIESGYACLATGDDECIIVRLEFDLGRYKHFDLSGFHS